MAKGYDLDVDEDLVLALLVPHLEACVARVAEDGPNGRLGPLALAASAVAIAFRIVRRRRGDAVGVEARGDQVQAEAAHVLLEDSLNDDRRNGVGRKPAEPLTVGGLAGVRVGAGVGELIAVWRTTAEVAAFDGGLAGHRRADAGLDAHAFALAHSAVERHDQVVGFGARVDCATDLGYPQLDAVVREDGEGEPELVAVEGALRLADHDGVELSLRIAEGLEEAGGLGPALPREGTRLPDVEELLDDLAVWFDGLARAGELPVP